MTSSHGSYQAWLLRVGQALTQRMQQPARTEFIAEVTPRPRACAEVKQVCPYCGQSIIEMSPWDGERAAT